MKNNYFKLSIMVLFFMTLVFACKKDDNDNNDDNNNNIITPVEHKYTASASYGDIIRYTFDVTNNTYSFTNETTGETGSGTFAMSSDPNLTGVYEITANSNIYYVIELAEKAFATSDPSGRPENKLTFGVSADLDLSTNYTPADIAGKYLFITYSDFFNDSTDWGGFELFADGTYSYNFGPNYVEDFDDNNQFTGAGSGTWAISPTNHSRIIFTEGGNDYTGTVYPEKVLMIDNGVGNGFSLGIKYPSTHVTQSSVAGTYRYLDITSTGETGVGFYTLPASGGTLNYYYKYSGTSGEGSGTCNDFASTPTVQNMFEASEVIDSVTYTTYFIILPGEVMLHFCMDPNGTISYGLGAKIN